MTGAAVVCRTALESAAVLDARGWREDLAGQVQLGARVVTVFGRRKMDHVELTSVVQQGSGALRVTRGIAGVESGYHALTSELPALHCFERELHEQTGVRMAGHPWLKPVRHECHASTPMRAYPYYVIEGKEVHEVAVGPIHAGVIEPGSFRFMCLGERVHHLEIQLGYQHRGVERLLLQGDPTRLAPLVETIAGDSSVAHAWAYCAGLEALADCVVDSAAELGRAFVLELERVAMHLSTLAGLAADVAFQQGAATYGRLRTAAINSTMLLCGSRFGRTAVRPGCVGLGLRDGGATALRANLNLLREDLPAINDCFLGAQSVQHRLREVGRISSGQARELGLVGLVARASGVPVDARLGLSGGSRAGFPALPVSSARGGDCWARAAQRVDEIDASLAWLTDTAAELPAWPAPPRFSHDLAPRELVVSVVEGFRGEVVHCLETGPAGELAHYKVQDPSFRNWMGLAIAVRDEEISDFPICNKSFDLSYCGNDL